VADGRLQLEYENEALRRRMQAHRNFIDALIAQAHELAETDKVALYRRGADLAVNMTTSIMRDFARAPESWSEAVVPAQLRRALPGHFAVRYRYVATSAPAPSAPLGAAAAAPTAARRFLLRTEQVFLTSAHDAISKFWGIWTDPTVVAKIYSKPAQPPLNVGIAVDFIDVVSCDSSSDARDARDGSVRSDDSASTSIAPARTAGQPLAEELIAVVRRTEHGISRLFVAAKGTAQVSEATFRGRGVGAAPAAAGAAATPAELHTIDVCVRSSCIEERTSETGLWVEGGYAMDLAQDHEPPQCLFVMIMSVPETFRIARLNGASDIVTPDGVVGDNFANVVLGFARALCGEQAGGGAAPSASSA